MKHVTIRIYDEFGYPSFNARIGIYVHHFPFSEMRTQQFTDHDGETTFALDIDSNAEISIYVDGVEYVSRGEVLLSYIIKLAHDKNAISNRNLSIKHSSYPM